MIKRYDIRPRRKRLAPGQPAEVPGNDAADELEPVTSDVD